ncbi:MAG: hypothetical protein DMD98_02280 [Candidatus Rokuibacteriota bacterium]|nr:MAG: hypothetical protein DMD98_02280 [Candidatus Rokubacteria bacterium]
MARPSIAAWNAVPQATNTTRWRALTVAGSRFTSGRTTLPVSGAMRPRNVSVIARGCSWISLSMKWR